jgi:hypothetical protein
MQHVTSVLNTKMAELGSLAQKVQQQAAAGQLPASEAVEQVLTAFLNLLGLLRPSLSASGGSNTGSKKALTALDRCQQQANAGARMVREAAGKQGGVAGDVAVQQLSKLLMQLAGDLSAELLALGPADAAASIKLQLPGGFGSSDSSSSSGGQGASWRATPIQSGAQLDGSKALQELQAVLAGGVEQGLAAAGGAMKEVCGTCLVSCAILIVQQCKTATVHKLCTQALPDVCCRALKP